MEDHSSHGPCNWLVTIVAIYTWNSYMGEPTEWGLEGKGAGYNLNPTLE
jgi:hypothetical protein